MKNALGAASKNEELLVTNEHSHVLISHFHSGIVVLLLFCKQSLSRYKNKQHKKAS